MNDTTLVRCGQCGADNRVPTARIAVGQRPICGRCKAPLTVGASAGPIAVTDATFVAEVERSPLPVLVDAWAAWCAPCRAVAPAIEELASELAGRVRVAKLNVDENPATAARFDVRSIPTMLVLRDGREIGRIVGAQPKDAIRARLESLIAEAHQA
jgi:thioredoxin 2